MPVLLPILITLLAGVGLAMQPPTNAAMAKVSGSLLLTTTVSFAMGTGILFTLWLALDRTPIAATRGAPWWAWAGGIYGAYFVTAVAFAAPRLGLASMLTMVAAVQLITALLLDHYGLLGMAREPVTLGRIGGVALVIVGVLLVRRG